MMINIRYLYFTKLYIGCYHKLQINSKAVFNSTLPVSQISNFSDFYITIVISYAGIYVDQVRQAPFWYLQAFELHSLRHLSCMVWANDWQ